MMSEIRKQRRQQVRAIRQQRARSGIDAFHQHGLIAHNETIEKVKDGYRALGYLVVSEWVPFHEREYLRELRRGLTMLEKTLRFVNERYRTRGRSKRAITMLHELMPEPIFGVRVKE